MGIFKSAGVKVVLIAIFALAASGTTPSSAMIPDESGPVASTQNISSVSPIALNDTNSGKLKELLAASDDLDQNHKSRKSVLFFFGQPANVHAVSAELDKLATEYRDKLTVVVVDPASSLADEMLRAWVQGDPVYPSAIFRGNGVLLPISGAIAPANLEQLAKEGMNWDWNKNH